MSRLYVLPGLAADHRTFGQFAVPGMQIIPLRWVHPDKTDSLADYATKVRHPLQEDEPFSLLGISFGGMVMRFKTHTLPTPYSRSHSLLPIAVVDGRIGHGQGFGRGEEEVMSGPLLHLGNGAAHGAL